MDKEDIKNKNKYGLQYMALETRYHAVKNISVDSTLISVEIKVQRDQRFLKKHQMDPLQGAFGSVCRLSESQMD